MFKKILILALLILASVLAYFFYVRQTRVNTPVDSVPDKINRLESADKKTDIKHDKKVEHKINTQQSRLSVADKNNIYQKAKDNLDADICFELQDQDSIDICISNIANQKKDDSLCLRVNEDEIKNECFFFIYIDRSKQEKTLKWCNKLNPSYPFYLRQCILATIDESQNADICKEIIYPKVYSQTECLERIFYFLGDPGGTLKKRHYTQEAFGLARMYGIDINSDTDNDGLLFYEEVYYNTRYDKADTDGDGYNDGDEIQSGYNPLGDGMLQY